MTSLQFDPLAKQSRFPVTPWQQEAEETEFYRWSRSRTNEQYWDVLASWRNSPENLRFQEKISAWFADYEYYERPFRSLADGSLEFTEAKMEVNRPYPVELSPGLWMVAVRCSETGGDIKLYRLV